MKRIEFILIVTLISVIICFGCKASYNIEGEYSQTIDNNNLYVLHHLKLNDDSTFVYQYKFDHIFEYSSGHWNVSKNKIILKSEVEDILNIPIIVEEYTNTKQINTFLFANLSINNNTIGWDIVINDTINYPITDSVIEIDKTIKVSKFYIKGIKNSNNPYNIIYPTVNDTVRSIVYHVNNNGNNNYDISLCLDSVNNVLYYKPIEDSIEIKKWKHIQLK
ncbi:MAG: hypothetical protein H6Q15_1663 [Bacteroidetes bacterium]|nr:hypothetical protein [Bacteroidota bacterium]